MDTTGKMQDGEKWRKRGNWMASKNEGSYNHGWRGEGRESEKEEGRRGNKKYLENSNNFDRIGK